MPIPEKDSDKLEYLRKKFERIKDKHKNFESTMRRTCKLMYKFNKKLKKEYASILDKKFNKYTGIPRDIMELSGFYYWTDGWDSVKRGFYKETIVEPKSAEDMFQIVMDIPYQHTLSYQTVIDLKGICYYYKEKYVFKYYSHRVHIAGIVIYDDGTVRLL